MKETCSQCGKPADLANLLCHECNLLEALPDKLASLTKLGGVPFHDMKSVGEDQRIVEIVAHLKNNRGRTVAVMVDTGKDFVGKGDRYIAKVQKLLPAVKIANRRNGPIPEIETIRFLLPP